MKNTCKLAKRCYEKLEQGDFEEGTSSKKYRAVGGGRKSWALEVRETLFEWFVDVRTSLKARLPKTLFKLKAKAFYEDWLQQNLGTPDEENFNFQTNGLKARKRNMEFRYENQINGTRFLKKFEAFHQKVFHQNIWRLSPNNKWGSNAIAPKWVEWIGYPKF